MAVASALEARRRQRPPAELTSVGWVVSEELPYEEWLRQGSRLGLAGRNSRWWIGDWVRYGTSRYGKKYEAAVRVTGYDRQTLMNMVYVASRFEISRRRENLSWSHHAEVAALEPVEQEDWLERAAVERLSVRDLRDLREPLKKVPARPAARKAASAKQQQPVSCPNCGHHFVP